MKKVIKGILVLASIVNVGIGVVMIVAPKASFNITRMGCYIGLVSIITALVLFDDVIWKS